MLSFEAGSAKVKASLERMETSLSGKKLIQEATLAAEAVERIGGVSGLTEDELQRLGTQAAEATEKMKLMGSTCRRRSEGITVAAGKAATATATIGTAAEGDDEQVRRPRERSAERGREPARGRRERGPP